MKKIFLLLILFLLTLTIIAQTGIKGVVRDSKTKENLIGSTIIIENTSIGVITDINGIFALYNLKPDTYKLKISYVSYVSKEQNVLVENNKITQIEVEMEQDIVSLSDITIIGIKRNNIETSIISQIKTSNVVISGISSQLISKTQDKDASEVVKRLPGVSIVNDKFIIIRGLSSRYNNVWINNSTAPSSEPDTRSFSFDLIPSSIIENILIYKSPTSEYPSNYSGGFIKLSTIGIPLKDNVSLSYETSFTQYTTFKDFFKQTEHWAPIKSMAIPEQKLLLSINKKFDKKNFTFGNSTILRYSYSNDHKEILNNSYSIYDFKNDQPNPNDEFRDSQYKFSNKYSLLNNWTFYPSSILKIDFKNFFNYISNSLTTLRNGREWYNDGRFNQSTELFESNRFIYITQIGINRDLKNSSIDLTGGYSLSIKNEPDIRRYRYISSDNETFIINFSNNPDLSSLSRMNLNLNENILTSSLNYTRSINLLQLKTGIFFENKWREFRARNFGYVITDPNSTLRYTSLPIDEIFATNELKLQEITAPSDSYTSAELTLAGYLNGTFNLEKFNISAGVRIEKNIQTLNSFRQGTTIPVNVRRDTINLFPSTNIAYKINDKNIIRTTYGMSTNRPEFREMAPFYFVDFDLNAGIYGNENIKSAYIHNFDLRYEVYPKNDETFNIGVFYKRFINPIEVVIRGNNPTQYSFENVPYAYSYGIEIEGRKSLSFIGLDNFSTVANLSLIKSNIEFDRPLQGQSPYIVNLGLYYNKNKNSFSATYNLIGKRIIAVGRPSPNEWESIPDIYEMPRNELNLIVSKRISDKWEIKAAIKDIFNQNIKYQQNINTDVDMSIYGSQGIEYFNRNQITRLYRPGRQFTLNLSYKF